MAQAGLVVQATSGAGRSQVEALPLAALPTAGVLWSDLNYWDAEPPHRTELRRAGHRFDDGWGMLVAQALEAFHLFTGVRLARSVAHALLPPRGA